MGSTEPPLFAGEPEHCSLCGEPGHTHDDHWLFQHEVVIEAIRKRDEAIRKVADVIDGMLTWKDCQPGLVACFEEWLALPVVVEALQKKSKT